MTEAEDRTRAPRLPRVGALSRGVGAGLLLLGLAAAPLPGQVPDSAAAGRDTLPPDPIPADSVVADTIPAGVMPADTTAADTIPPEAAAADTTPAADTIPPETGAADTTTTAADTTTAPADTTTTAADTTTAAADTTTAAADSLPPPENLPALPEGVPAGPGTAVWEWSREELLADRALTLTGLLEQIPGVIPLRGGDFGTPRAVSAHGSAGGGIRVFRDGVEMVPLEGSVPDLARIGLGSLERVRVFRTGWGVRIELETIRPSEPRPYSLIEAGTGALDTNIFRGGFVHPRALGGNVALSLDRIDTTGRDREQPGSISAVWLRYSYLRGDRFGLVAEFNRATEDRDTLYAPSVATRTDWVVRGRARLTEGVVADAFWSTASLNAGDEGDGPSFDFRDESRGQLGAGVSASRGPFFGRASYRSFSGDGLPSGRLSVEAGADHEAYGGIVADWSREWWPRDDASRLTLRAWTRPLFGASIFGSVDDYERAVPYLPPLPPEMDGGDEGDPDDDDPAPVPISGPLFTEGRSTRLGALFRWRGLELTGARLTEQADGLHPFDLPMDRGGLSLPAGPERTGWEAIVRIPLLADGLSLSGGGQLWRTPSTPDSAAVPDSLRSPTPDSLVSDVPVRPYLPRRSWNASLNFHDTFLPTENLEIWADVGLRGRDPMRVPLRADPEREGSGEGADPGRLRDPERPADLAAVVPAYRNWFARLQIRVVTVRIFVTWENFIIQDENQDFPGRLLPRTRTLYGVRWTLWN